MRNKTIATGEPAMNLLGKAIRQRRKTLRLTQGELAEMAGISKNLLCQVENGKPTVQVIKLLDIISMLGMRFVLENGKDRIFISDEFLKR